MKFIYSILFLFLVTIGSAQTYKKALVTDINYTLKKNNYINSTTFPFYFHRIEFIQDVYKDIEKHLIKKFGNMEVEFMHIDSISYALSRFTQPTSAKMLSRSKNSLADLYVSVESILKLNTDIEGVMTYSFITKVKVFNSKGRSVYKFQNIIPFNIVLEDNITGDIEISENDFYFFYLDGLKLAFEGKSQIEPKRYIIKPAANYYNRFLQRAYKFYLTTNSNKYFYGTSLDNQKKIFEFTESSPEYGSSGYEIDFFSYSIKDRYYTFNFLSNDSLQVKLKDIENIATKILVDTSGLGVEVYQKNLLVGEFEAINAKEIKGTLFDIDFLIRWNYKYFVSEFYIDDQLRFIMNNLGRKRNIYIHEGVSEKELAQFFNLIFIYDYFIALKK